MQFFDRDLIQILTPFFKDLLRFYKFAVASLIKISTLEIPTISPFHFLVFLHFGLQIFTTPQFITQCRALMRHVKLTSRANSLKAAFLSWVLFFGSPLLR